MGIRDTQAGEPDRSAEPVDEATTGARRVVRTLRVKLAEWSRVHARMQVDLLADQRTER